MIYRLIDWFSQRRKNRAFPGIKKILILRPDRLGDVLLTLPAVYNVKSAFPDAEIHYVCREYTAPIVRSYRPVSDILIFPEDQDRKALQNLTEKIKILNFDLAIHLLPKASLARVTYAAKIRYRVGMGYRLYSVFYNLRQFEHRKYNKYHEAEYNLRMLRLLNIDTTYSDQTYHQFLFDPQAEEKAAAIINKNFGREPFILIHPGSGGSSLDWPLEYFIHLIKLLNDWNAYQIGITGTETERRKLSTLLNSPIKIKDLVGKLDLIQLAVASRQASLFIANSTGPLHLAVAMGTPVLGFYPTAYDLGPKRWGPFMRPAEQVLTPNDCLPPESRRSSNLDMTIITPQKAMAQIRAILQNY